MKQKLCAAVLSAAFLLLSAAGWYAPAHAEGEEPPAETLAETTPGETQETTEPQPRVEDLYRFEINIAGEAEIYDFLQEETYQGEVIIPDMLDGCPVSYIGNAAFENATGVTSISIPASVIDMGSNVFMGCTGLEKLIVREGNTYLKAGEDGVLLADEGKFLVAYPAAKAGDTYQIPAAVDEIAPACFYGAKNLKQITIPGHVNFIDSMAFAYSSIEKAVIQGCQYVDDFAFAHCEKLQTVEFSSGTETIYDGAFSNCTALTDVTLPDTLTTVGQCAFAGTAMHSVTIPYSVNSIDYSAFGYDADLHQISDFVVYGYAGTAGESYCTTQDPENDYYNDFTFLQVEETQAGNQADGDAENPENAGNADAENADVSGETDNPADVRNPEDAGNPDAATESPVTDNLGATVKDNTFLRILFITLGTIAVILALLCIILAAKKPKNK